MEKFKQSKNIESDRNTERNRATFTESIKNIEINDIDTDFDEKSVESLMTELEEVKLFLLGEMHGVKENVDVVYTLFKKFGFKKLALEWDKILQKSVENFLQTGGLDFETIKNSIDGRITAGHFALLKKLKDEGLLEEIVCFDDWWGIRDANMAKNIMANLSDSATLVVAGNIHTRVESFTFEDEEEEYHPMGEYIKNEIPNVLSGNIRYLKGQYYNEGIKTFNYERKGVTLPKARFFKSSDDSLYLFDIPEANIAIVPNQNEVLFDES